MNKGMVLVVVFFMLTGFKWGFSGADDTDKNKDAPSSTSYSQSRDTQIKTSDVGKTSVKNELLQKPVTKAETKKIVKKNPTKKTDAAPVAVSTGAKPVSVITALASDNPDLIKQRVESLSRVSHALKALNDKRAGK